MNKPPVYAPAIVPRKLVQGHGMIQAKAHGAVPPVYRPVPGLAHTPGTATLQSKAAPVAAGLAAGRMPPGFTPLTHAGAVQRKTGPPPLASEILARLNTPRAGTVQRKPMPQGNVFQRTGMQHGAPAKPPMTLPAAPPAGPASSVQRFKVKRVGAATKDYNNKAKVLPLIAEIQAAGTYPGKDANVKYWLEQYVTLYARKTFEPGELDDYLYDDIVRENKPIGDPFVMGAQELLTSEQGLARLKNRVQPLPASTPLRFYRAMSLTELKDMLKDPAHPDEEVGLPQVGRELVGRLNPAELGRHLGDYKQAKSYYNAAGPKALLEFTIKSSTAFFKSDKLALPKSKKIFDDPLRAMFGGGHQEANSAEGLNDELPGLKSEKRGVYSVSLTTPAARVFLDQVTSVKVVMIKNG